jgi:single-strand DNA-binding protein
MADFNKVVLLGNLTRSPEERQVAGESYVYEFGLAINRKYKKDGESKEEACFVDVSAWGSLGKNCFKYLEKGDPALVEGYLKFSEWEKNGEKRSKLRVVALNVQFLKRKDEKIPF